MQNGVSLPSMALKYISFSINYLELSVNVKKKNARDSSQNLSFSMYINIGVFLKIDFNLLWLMLNDKIYRSSEIKLDEF